MHSPHPALRATAVAGTVLLATVLAAGCRTESSASPTSPATTSPTSSTATSIPEPLDLEVIDGAPFPADRCALNRAAGTIVYLSSFDFAATASIVDVLVAEERGYYDELCLDVELRPSFSVDNYPLVAANEAQFSSGGSFSEIVDFAGANDAGFVALAVEGRTGIDALLVTDPQVESLDDLDGAVIGVKGAVTPSVRAMLAAAGLTEGAQYDTVLLDGFDPLLHASVPGIAGFPVYKSNEPLRLDAAGVDYRLFDPSDEGVPGSFGIVYTNQTFLEEHPTAAEDFMRATMRGLAEAIADPAAAGAIAVKLINDGGNALNLSPAGEIARWEVESELIVDGVRSGAPLGVPIIDQLEAEVAAYAAVGLFEGVVPDISSMVDPTVVAALYDDGELIWPSP